MTQPFERGLVLGENQPGPVIQPTVRTHQFKSATFRKNFVACDNRLKEREKQQIKQKKHNRPFWNSFQPLFQSESPSQPSVRMSRNAPPKGTAAHFGGALRDILKDGYEGD